MARCKRCKRGLKDHWRDHPDSEQYHPFEPEDAAPAEQPRIIFSQGATSGNSRQVWPEAQGGEGSQPAPQTAASNHANITTEPRQWYDRRAADKAIESLTKRLAEAEKALEQAAKTLNAGGHRTTCGFSGCTCGAVDDFKTERLEFFRMREAAKRV